MKSLSFILSLGIMLFSLNAFALAGYLMDGGAQKVNPSANTVLAATGTLSSYILTGAACPDGGDYFVHAYCTGSVAFLCEFQVVDGSGTVQQRMDFNVMANDTKDLTLGSISIPVEDGWSMQVVVPSAVSGTVQGSFAFAFDQCW